MKIRPEVGVSTAVFRDGRVLLAQRAVGALAGLWSLPGGRVEFGEKLAEAALRELDEEVGVEAEIVDFAGVVEVLPRKEGAQFHFVVIAFAANWVSGEPQTGPEAADIRWADPMTLDGLPVTDDLHRIVALAAALILPETITA
jgi:ADP-ribose pyrophosphatase YjhB (NUDIX family)